jgi:hypothetical protein
MGQSADRVRGDVDPEAYLMHVVHLAVATSATGPITRSMFVRPDRPDGPDADAQVAELVRIARTSLFNPRPTDK